MAGDFDNSVSFSLSAKVNEKPFYVRSQGIWAYIAPDAAV